MRTNKVCRRCDGCVWAHTLIPLVTDTFKAEGWKCRVKFQIYFELAEIQGDLWTRAQSSCCHNWESHFLEHMRHSVQGKHLLFFCFFIFLSAIWWPFEQEKHITHTADSLESRSHSPLLTQTWTPKDNELLTEEASKSKCLLKEKIPICAPITITQILRFLTAWKCPYILHLAQEREHYLNQRCPFIRLPPSWFLTL